MQERDWVKEKIVSIDFDGVLAKYEGFKGPTVLGEPIKGAKEFVQNIIDSGFTPVIFTARKPKLIIAWLEEYEFPDVEVTNMKYPSLVYIDDRCVKFDGDFSKLVNDLKEFKVHWKKEKYDVFLELKDIK